MSRALRSAEQLLDAALRAPSVLLTGPVGADGDSLGASLALERVLSDAGVSVHVTGQVGERYAFLPRAERLLTDEQVATRAQTEPWHTVVVLDGDRQRLLPGVERAWHAATSRMVVDHHVSTTDQGYDVAWIEAGATSTCQMLLGLLRHRGIELDAELATLLHTGTIFDTGGLRFENTTPAVLRDAAELVERGAPHAQICTHVLLERRWAALQALSRVLGQARLHAQGRVAISAVPASLTRELGLIPDDLEGIVDHLLFVRGVQVAALLFERDEHTKVSLRSRGRVDVAALARQLAPSGGGHRRAAGARSTLPAATLVQRIVASVDA